MARWFVSEFLLPLVHGGTLSVGRPLFPRDLNRLRRIHTDTRRETERDAATALGFARRRALLPLVSAPPLPVLDAETWRLGAAVHNLLALAHPAIASGPGAESRIERISAAITELAQLGPPPNAPRALTRHSLVGRLPDVVREDHTVRFWLGRRTFVGRRPPTRVLALPRLRAVQVESVRRTWLRDVGILAVARPAFIALTEASPLGEAFDPLRLDPPWSWGRVLSILKFPPLCRAVAGNLVEQGVARTGDALAEALYRFISLEDANGPVPSSPDAVAFAVGFLAHLTWLGQMFTSPVARGPAGQSVATSAGGAGRAGGSGRELAVVLAAAAHVDRRLIWPPDVVPTSDIGRSFQRDLDVMFARADVTRSPRWSAALDVARLAAVATHARGATHAV